MTPGKVVRAGRVERSDVELVIAIAAGDLTSLGLLFDRYSADVRRLLARLGIGSSDLDDMVQQTFLDVPRASVRFRTDAPVRPWLLGLAAVVARRQRRTIWRALRRLEMWGREGNHNACVPTPAETYECSTELRRVWAALEQLSPKQRDAFVLVVLEGLSCAEAAEILATPIATVWTRIHHARAELKRTLLESA